MAGVRRRWADLLLGQIDREFAVADAQGQPLGKPRGRLLAIRRNEFGEGGKQASLRQAVAIDAVETGFRPGLAQIAEGRALVLVVPTRVPCH